MILKKDNFDSCEIKFAKDKEGVFEGYASKFNGNDAMNDTILPGAYTKTIESKKRIPMLHGHNPGKVIGKWMHMEEDSSGLLVVGEFTPNHSEAQNVYASAKHGATDGMSIGFRMGKDDFEKKEDEDGGRIIKNIDLVEVSIVTFPADADARISIVKEEILDVNTIKDAEHILRESGWSRSMATAFVSQFKGVIQRESGDAKDEQIAEFKRQIMEYHRLLNVQNSTAHLVQAIKNMRN